MPWMILRQNPSASPIEQDLDYTAMLPPVALYQSLKRRHFFVAIAIAASLLLKVQVVLAASLFRLVVIDVVDKIDVQVLDVFSREVDVEPGVRSRSVQHARALRGFDMNPPFGVSGNLAYQTFTTSEHAANNTSRPSAQSPVTAVVDGFFTNATCLMTEDFTLTVDEQDTITIHFDFAECSEPIDLEFGYWYEPSRWAVVLHDKEGQPCSALSDDAPQTLYYGYHYASEPFESGDYTLDGSAAVLCSGHAWTAPVEVVDDGTNPRVSVAKSDESDRTPFDFDFWGTLHDALEESEGYYFEGGSEIRGAVKDYLETMGRTLDPGDLSLYSSELLREAVESEISAYGPVLAHYLLRKESQEQISGSKSAPSTRLHVRLGVCIAVIVIFALVASVALIMSWQALGIKDHYSRDPATILGSLAVMHGDTNFHDKVSQASTSTRPTRMTEWADGSHSPLVLRWWYRALAMLYALGLIIGLSVTLEDSNTHDGIADIDDERSYISLLWQSVPSMTMLAMSLYASSSDSAIRGLSTHISLSTRPCHPSELDKSLLDMLGIRALIFSVKYRLPSVTLSQILALLCGVLPTLGSVLFQSELVPASVIVQVDQLSWFGYRDTGDGEADLESFGARRETIAALGLMRSTASSLNYPQNTYRDLVFPAFKLEGMSMPRNGSTVTATLPAAKLLPTCVELGEDDYDIEPYYDSISSRIHIFRDLTCPDGDVLKIERTLFFQEGDWFIFGSTMYSEAGRIVQQRCNSSTVEPWNTTSSTWWEQIYIWGNHTADPEDEDRLAIWACNYTWFEVPTRVTLLPVDGGTLQIDSQNPPQEDTSASRPWEPPFSVPVFEDDMTNRTDGTVFFNVYEDETVNYPITPRYSIIREPYGPLEKDVLADPTQDQAVLEALHSNLAFFTAQLANLEYRLLLNETSEIEPRTHPDLSPLELTITDNRRYRLVQDATVTYITIAILVLHVAVSTWASISTLLRRLSSRGDLRRPWLLDMDLRGLAPNGFNSFALTDALLADSNVHSHLPKDPHLLPAVDLQAHLAGKTFRLGWFFDLGTETDRLTVGALHDDTFVFKGEKWKSENFKAGSAAG